MITKKKQCSQCQTEQYIWKNSGGKKWCKNCWGKFGVTQPSSKEKTNSSSIPSRSPIKRVSDKRKALDELYKILRTEFLKNHPKCAVCGGKADQVHHMKGKVGELYLDDSFFLAVDFKCHRRIEEEPEWAKEMGYSESRLKK